MNVLNVLYKEMYMDGCEHERQKKELADLAIQFAKMVPDDVYRPLPAPDCPTCHYRKCPACGTNLPASQRVPVWNTSVSTPNGVYNGY